MGPTSKVLTPAIVESWFSSSAELTAAMALIQTAVIGVVLLVLTTVTQQAARAGE
jgi:iron(III) transport system permease protein